MRSDRGGSRRARRSPAAGAPRASRVVRRDVPRTTRPRRRVAVSPPPRPPRLSPDVSRVVHLGRGGAHHREEREDAHARRTVGRLRQRAFFAWRRRANAANAALALAAKVRDGVGGARYVLRPWFARAMALRAARAEAHERAKRRDARLANAAFAAIRHRVARARRIVAAAESARTRRDIRREIVRVRRVGVARRRAADGAGAARGAEAAPISASGSSRVVPPRRGAEARGTAREAPRDGDARVQARRGVAVGRAVRLSVVQSRRRREQSALRREDDARRARREKGRPGVEGSRRGEAEVRARVHTRRRRAVRAEPRVSVLHRVEGPPRRRRAEVGGDDSKGEARRQTRREKASRRRVGEGDARRGAEPRQRTKGLRARRARRRSPRVRRVPALARARGRDARDARARAARRRAPTRPRDGG